MKGRAIGAGVVLAMLGAATGSVADGRPITLVTKTTAAGVTVEVIGQVREPLQAAYRLEMSSGVAGGNHSVQSGASRLEAGQRVVLLTAHLGGNAGAKWKARLNVRLMDGEAYEIVEQADQVSD